MDEIDTSATALQGYHNVRMVHLKVVIINCRVRLIGTSIRSMIANSMLVPQDPWTGIREDCAQKNALRSWILNILLLYNNSVDIEGRTLFVTLVFKLFSLSISWRFGKGAIQLALIGDNDVKKVTESRPWNFCTVLSNEKINRPALNTNFDIGARSWMESGCWYTSCWMGIYLKTTWIETTGVPILHRG